MANVENDVLVRVHNTFIEVSTKPSSTRPRCKSCPSLRSLGSIADYSSRELSESWEMTSGEALSIGYLSRACSCASLDLFEPLRDQHLLLMSTRGDNHCGELVSTSQSDQLVRNDSSEPLADMSAERMHNDALGDFDGDDEASPASEEGLPPVPACTEQVRTPLRAIAAKWRPTGSVFKEEAFALVEEVAAVLLQEYGLDARVTMGEHPCSECVVSLVANFKPSDTLEFQQACEAAAKDNIYERTNKTRGVCLIGYKAAPFLPKQAGDGFTATFATVVSRRRGECRVFYRTGRCFGDCHKEHPVNFICFEFAVMLQRQ